MARKALFSDAEVFGAVGALMATGPAVTTTQIQEAVGLSTGSLYHRFGSREGLLAETWLHALLAFQPVFVRALETQTAVGEIAAVTPRFCRERRSEAIILSCCSSREFLGPRSPPALTRRIRETNTGTSTALKSFARGRGFNLDACRLALIAFPLAAVRQYLPSRVVPASVDDVVARAADAVIHPARDPEG